VPLDNRGPDECWAVAGRPPLLVQAEIESPRGVVAGTAQQLHASEGFGLVCPFAVRRLDLLFTRAAPGIGAWVPRILGPPEPSGFAVSNTLDDVLADEGRVLASVFAALYLVRSRSHVRRPSDRASAAPGSADRARRSHVVECQNATKARNAWPAGGYRKPSPGGDWLCGSQIAPRPEGRCRSGFNPARVPDGP